MERERSHRRHDSIERTSFRFCFIQSAPVRPLLMYRVELLEEKARRERAVEALERRKRADEQSKAEKSSAGEQKVEKASRTPVQGANPIQRRRSANGVPLKTPLSRRCAATAATAKGAASSLIRPTPSAVRAMGLGHGSLQRRPRAVRRAAAPAAFSRRTLQELPSSHGSGHEALVQAFLDGSIICEGCNGLGGVRSFQGKQSYMSSCGRRHQDHPTVVRTRTIIVGRASGGRRPYGRAR